MKIPYIGREKKTYKKEMCFKQGDEKWEITCSSKKYNFHLLVGCLAGFQEEEKKDQLCDLHLQFEICPLPEIRSLCLLSHEMKSHYSSG